MAGEKGYDNPISLYDAEQPITTLPLTVKVYDFPKALSKLISTEKGYYNLNGPLGNGL